MNTKPIGTIEATFAKVRPLRDGSMTLLHAIIDAEEKTFLKQPIPASRFGSTAQTPVTVPYDPFDL